MNVFVVREIKDAFETVKDLEKKYGFEELDITINE